MPIFFSNINLSVPLYFYLFTVYLYSISPRLRDEINKTRYKISTAEKDKNRLGDKLKEALPELNNLKVKITYFHLKSRNLTIISIF